MAHNDTGTFLSYWQALRRKAGQTPLRSDLDPIHLNALLPSAFILTARDGFRFRLIGERVERLHGTHLKGRALTELFGEAHAALVVASLTLARQREEAVCLKVHVPLETMDATGELMLVPLRNDKGLVDRFAGVYALHSGWPRHFASVHPLDIEAPLAGKLSLLAAQIENTQPTAPNGQTRLIVLNDHRRVA